MVLLASPDDKSPTYGLIKLLKEVFILLILGKNFMTHANLYVIVEYSQDSIDQ